jgi:hypothetical protein
LAETGIDGDAARAISSRSGTFNVLLNPNHPDAGRIVVDKVGEHVIDARLLK